MMNKNALRWSLKKQKNGMLVIDTTPKGPGGAVMYPTIHCTELETAEFILQACRWFYVMLETMPVGEKLLNDYVKAVGVDVPEEFTDNVNKGFVYAMEQYSKPMTPRQLLALDAQIARHRMAQLTDYERAQMAAMPKELF